MLLIIINDRFRERFGLERIFRITQFQPSTIPDCSKPHPALPWPLPGIKFSKYSIFVGLLDIFLLWSCIPELDSVTCHSSANPVWLSAISVPSASPGVLSPNDLFLKYPPCHVPLFTSKLGVCPFSPAQNNSINLIIQDSPVLLALYVEMGIICFRSIFFFNNRIIFLNGLTILNRPHRNKRWILNMI